MSAHATLATVHPLPDTDPPPTALHHGSAPTAPTPIESARTASTQHDLVSSAAMTRGALALRYQLEPELDVVPAPAPPASGSYTHLRSHETDSDRV
jgi:hypothetical protein